MSTVEDVGALAQQTSAHGVRLRYKRRYLRCEVPPADHARLVAAVELLPGAMRGQLHSLDIKPIVNIRQRGLYRLRVGAYRVIFWPIDAEIVVLELDRKDDTTYAHLDRLVVHRRGAGVQVTEVPEAVPEPGRVVGGRAPSRCSIEPVLQNPLTVFTTAQLQQIGLSADAIGVIRTLAATVEVADALAGTGMAADQVELVADMWHDPGRYLAIFDDGRVPTPDDARIAELELAQRLRSPESSDAVAELAARDFELVLAGSIEEWMFYLHPSQARIVSHVANGPSRVRGGPGTGKTVAALHRARHLVEHGRAERVLLTTFVNVLPSVWGTLLQRFAPESAGKISARTVDSLVFAITAAADGEPAFLPDDQIRKLREELCRKTAGLAEAVGGPAELGTEFETVLAGRGVESLDDYLALERPGRGRRLGADERRLVWTAWQSYLEHLRREGRTDWPLLRRRAVELAEAGAGPRFDAVIVDEAQDLTAMQVRLLMALDTAADHRNLMFVGDGQQAIYPGGFSLRSVGLDVRGRSFLLHTNWRNTQSIAAAAEAVMGDVPFGDLEEEAAPRPPREAPLPRRRGELPELHLVGSDAHGDEVLRGLLEEALTQFAPADVAVLGRTKKAWQRGERALKALGVESVVTTQLARRADGAPDAVRVGTFEGSKGLEFKLVVLVGYRKGDWTVQPFWLKDRGDRDEWWDTERRKLFVAMTRARDRLALLAWAPLSDSLEQARERFDEWDWTA
ncbi:UvrD-like helicase family protein [Solirubrobacter pauli]|uniref:DNA 3'-5' helicase n=1 Tax=Solirubrobacter pauli TaxID=166793 RepID=A0A660L8Q2_9ACTN|nr:UvrD-helicase domain-containing protein [Solirubrobacter pauli]RKQ90899.1 UvrD-like helicase family protein [Solirubrobacter pauli]